MSNEIHGLMVKVMKSLTEVGKDKKNEHFGFKYRGIDDAMNNLGAACRMHGVVTSWRTEHEKTEPGPKGMVTTLRGTVSFVAPDGSKIESSGYGVGVDNADKGGNKAMAAAFKYAVFMGLCIPVEAGVLDDADSEGDAPAVQDKPVSNRKQKGWPSPAEMEKMELEALRELSQQIASAEGKDSMAYKQAVEIGKKKKGSA